MLFLANGWIVSTAYHYANAHHHAIASDMAGVITAHFPLVFPIFLFAQNRGK